MPRFFPLALLDELLPGIDDAEDFEELLLDGRLLEETLLDEMLLDELIAFDDDKTLLDFEETDDADRELDVTTPEVCNFHCALHQFASIVPYCAEPF